MEYKQDKPIYLQIADYICNEIILEKWAADERIPSVREFAILLGVNPNTVVRSFDNIEQKGIIYNKRGIGYFVHLEARVRILELYKREFFTELLPEVFRQMELYGITVEDINEKYLVQKQS